nr:hypothetical protein [Tanacetum cinerariifolium]
MFMANLSSADPITDEAGPSYDLDILSEVQDHDQYLDDTCAYQEEHVMHDSVQLDHVVDLHADHTSINNFIPYDQYVKDNDVSVVHSTASSVPNDTFMMIYDDMCEPIAPSESHSSRNAAVKNSLTAELATYREQVELYKRRAKFELTEREQEINKQLRLVISDRNLEEETLKRELHSIKLQLTSTINRNKSMAQPALYNGHEILKDNHARAKVHNSKDTLEIAELIRKKMNAKMTTLNKQLTPEQIYWSSDLMKLKSKALKERAKVFRPMKTFTVITPSAITDGEQGFKQTKACYLKEVILFFQTIKDNFEGIQKSLTREVKQMKNVFEELEAEVAQCAVDRKHDAIDLKNLLIANDNLIAECLYKVVFSVATKSELNVARFAEMHVANTSVEARCLALEAELATLRDKRQYRKSPPSPNKDTPDFDSVFVIGKMQASLQEKDNVIRQLKKQISQLQVTNSEAEYTVKVRTTDSQLTKVTDRVTNLQAQTDCLKAENDKVKHHYKQLYDSIKITRAKHIEQVTKVTAKNVTLKTSVSKAKHSQELLEYAIGTCPPSSQPRAKQLAYTPLIRKKQVTAIKPSDRLNSNKDKHVVTKKIQKTNVPVPYYTGVKCCLKASGSQPKSNHKTNRISPAKDKDTPDFDSVFVIGQMQASLQGKDNVIFQLKKQISKLQVTNSDTECTVKVRTTDSQLTKVNNPVTNPVTNLQAQTDCLRAKNDKVKQHYKKLYDSIKITRAKHIEQVTKFTAENVTLKTSVSKAKVQPPALTRTKHAVDVEPIVPRLRNNREAHLDYLRHLKESVETIYDIVEEAKVVRPLDRSIVSACRYTQHSQKLLEYAIGTCPPGSQPRAIQLAHTPLIRKKQVTTIKPFDRLNNNKNKHVVTQKIQKTNVPVPYSTGVKRCPKASGSQPKSNHKTNRISPAKGANKLPVEDLPRMNKSHPRTTNRIDSNSCLKRFVINSNLDSVCQTCNKCLTSFDHDMCVAVCVKSVVLPHSTRHNCKVERKIKQVWKPKHVARKITQVWKPKQVRKVWKPTGKVLTTIGHQWRPTGRILHLGT